MHNLKPTIEYLTEFFTSKYPLYFEMMRDTGSTHFPESFEGEDDVIQGIRNIVHNIADNYSDLSIPSSFASPQHLLDALHGFQNMAETQLQQSLKINKALGNTWIDPISYSVKMNAEVKEAISYALTLTEETLPTFVPLKRLETILGALPKVAEELKKRRYDKGVSRPTILINDEYDLQDLIRSLLTIDFPDVRPEEWCPSYAGGSNRMDFLLKREKIVIEVKKTRSNHNSRTIGEELIIDISNYRQHKDCDHLVCYVWDEEKRISNPNGLKSDLEESNNNFVTVYVYQ